MVPADRHADRPAGERGDEVAIAGLGEESEKSADAVIRAGRTRRRSTRVVREKQREMPT